MQGRDNPNNSPLTDVALKVAEKRYFQRDTDGNLIEDWHGLCTRVVNHVCQNESDNFKKEMFDIIYNTKFLPNSPCLVNAGRKGSSGLQACFVTKAPEDTWEDICKNIQRYGDVARRGGGCGVSFSKIRPEGDPVFGSTHAKALGSIETMRITSEAMHSITQSGFRAMACMATLSVDHPDIEKFIICKQRERALKTLLKEDIFNHYEQINGNTHTHLDIVLDKFISNFNISVMASDKFMEAVKKDKEWDLQFNGKIYKTIKAKYIFNMIAENAWKNGDPGLIFEDRANEGPYKYSNQKINATNPCGEQPLPEFGSCNLGSIDISKFYKNDKFDWDDFKYVIEMSMQFLDNVINVNKYPSEEFDQWSKENRPVGLGVMGLFDFLSKMKIAYGSKKSIELSEKIAKFLENCSHNKSVELAKGRGTPKACQYKELEFRRNVTLTSIAPTGTISLLAGCSSAIEPQFSPTIYRYDNTGHYKMPHPDSDKEYFKCAIDKEQNGEREVSWKEHISIQSAWQKYGSSGISKTINMPSSATIEDVKQAYIFAYESKCKGVTVYRDGCKTTQVLNTESKTQTNQQNNAQTRPKELSCDIHKTAANGKDWHIIIGKLNGNPYELFAVNGKVELPSNGKILKKKKGHYSLLDAEDNMLIENLNDAEELINENLGYESRRFSLELRHNVPVKYIVEQIDKSDPRLVSFCKAVTRIFKKFYLTEDDKMSITRPTNMSCPVCAQNGENNEMISEAGCSKCPVCSFSKCG